MAVRGKRLRQHYSQRDKNFQWYGKEQWPGPHAGSRVVDFPVRMETTMATRKSKKKAAKKTVKKVVKKAAKMKARVAPKRKAVPPKKMVKKHTVPTAKKIVAKAAPRRVPGKKVVERNIRGKADGTEVAEFERRGLGARSGGQSGDTQGISGSPKTDSESVEELLEEGQAFEAEVVAGVESVPDADQGEVRTHEVPEDDIPEEYLGRDNQK